MSEKQAVNIKQRIVGAIVLVSLGVIIIPLLLNGGANQDQGISRTNIPPKPKALIKPLPEIPRSKKIPDTKIITNKPVYKSKPIKVEIANSKKIANAKKTDNVKKTVKSAKTPQYQKMSKPDSTKFTVVYTLQVASFSQRSNALNLRDKLRKKGFKAYTESIQTKKGKVYRLRVGPYLNYDQISSAQKKIEKKFKLTKTVIVKYKT